jgi:hypothetical protein
VSLVRTLEAMMAAGCSAEQLVAVARAHEAVEQDRVAQRRAADAERQRRSRLSRNVTVTPRDGCDGTPPKKETSPTPPKEKTTPSLSEAALPRTERKHAWPDDFCDQVWSIFPKHVEKKAGMDALKAVHRADKLDWQTLTTAITSLAATCEPQFVPALHRWLKGERWTDQRPVAKPGAGPPQRRTFGQLAAESAAEVAGYSHDHSHHQADDHRGPTLDIEPDRSGADLVDLQSHRAGRGGW